MSKHEEIKQSTPEVEIDENVTELAIKVDDEIKLSEEEFKNLNEVGLEAISGKEDLSKEEKIETIKSEAGAWNRVKIFAREVFSGKESEKRNKTYEKVTEKIINKELINLEKDGNKVVEKNNEARSEKVKLEKELKEMELNKEKFKHTTGVDLENVKKGMEGSKKFNPEKFNKYQTKYDEELASHENLISSKAESSKGFNEKSAEEIENLKTDLNLEGRINKFKEPAERKMEKLNGFEKNYSDLLNEAQTERKSYEDKVRGVEKILKGFKGDSELSQDMKKDIQAELDIEKENLRKLKEAEDKLKNRLDTIKMNKKETSDFIFKIECIGKTPKEIKEIKKEKQEQEKEKFAQTSAKSDVKNNASKQTIGGDAESVPGSISAEDVNDDAESRGVETSENTVEGDKKNKPGGKKSENKDGESVKPRKFQTEFKPDSRELIRKTREEWATLLGAADNKDYHELCDVARTFSKDKKTLFNSYNENLMYKIYLKFLQERERKGEVKGAEDIADEKFDKIRKSEN